MTHTLQTKSIKHLLLSIMAVLCLSFSANFLMPTANAEDATTGEKAAAKLAGATVKANDSGKGLIEDGKSLVYLMMAGGFVVIAGCIIVAAVKLAAAGDGKKRGEAMMWIGGAFLGAFIVYKAFDLLGYAITFGS